MGTIKSIINQVNKTTIAFVAPPTIVKEKSRESVNGAGTLNGVVTLNGIRAFNSAIGLNGAGGLISADAGRRCGSNVSRRR